MTPGSDYQRLRSHLAFLRMTAAAEALPGLLDEAAKAKLGNQAFLERLLAVEVAAVDERRKASLARFVSQRSLGWVPCPAPAGKRSRWWRARTPPDLRFVEMARSTAMIRRLRPIAIWPSSWSRLRCRETGLFASRRWCSRPSSPSLLRHPDGPEIRTSGR